MAETDPVEKLVEAIASVDKSMLHSKKFVSFMIIQACWTILLFYGIYVEVADSVLLAIVGALGTAQTAFLSVQAWHDKHVKTGKMDALINGNGHGRETEDKPPVTDETVPER